MQINLSINIDDRIIKFFKKTLTRKKIQFLLGGFVLFGFVIVLTAANLTRFNPGEEILANEVNANFTALNRAVAPTGTIIAYAGIIESDYSGVPEGWLVCDGQPYNVTAYTDLYNVIGTTYGGSGSYFQVPDLRGKFIRGNNFTLASDDSRANPDNTPVGGYQGDSTRSHNHQLTNYRINDTEYNYQVTYNCLSQDLCRPYNTLSYDSVQNTENTGGNETRPKSVTVNYLIKY